MSAQQNEVGEDRTGRIADCLLCLFTDNLSSDTNIFAF